jgi:hypothetical protein
MNPGLLSLALVVGQPIAPAVPPPALPASPFLFVTVDAGPGAQVTWLPGTKDATTTAAPVGLRPGYPYRFQITDLPAARGVTLYPSIEVRGSLVPRPGLADVSKHPVPILLTDHDIDRVLDGRLVTKVYYLEDPEKALGVTGSPGVALESVAESEEEAIREARDRGRPMLIVRVGERPYTKDELAAENVPGTILFPGAKTMPIPAVPPRFPFTGVIVYDPIIGAKGAGEECLKDGGDIGARAGPGPNGGIGGLDPSDTAMQFTTRYGTKVAPSNRVCICVPRFAAARVDTGPAAQHVVHAPEVAYRLQPVNALTVYNGPGQWRAFEQLRGFIGSKRASMLETRTGPAVLDLWSGRPAGFSNIRGAAVVAQARGPDEITAFPGCTSLLVQKSIDPPNPERIGQEVTVHLRFLNPTTETMTDVVVADNLTTRLEYVEGSAQSSRPATFSATPNGAGSVVLQWAIDGVLKPGESGTITFKVRIK